jgi:hypothetical protein
MCAAGWANPAGLYISGVIRGHPLVERSSISTAKQDTAPIPPSILCSAVTVCIGHYSLDVAPMPLQRAQISSAHRQRTFLQVSGT